MLRHAVIKEGKVVNVVLWDKITSWNPPEEHIAIECSEEVNIDDLYDYTNNSFTKADRIIPDNLENGE